MSLNEKSHQQQESNNRWKPPRPLLPALEPETQYPIDALPPMLRNAVTSYQHYGQQPVALVACSALANLSLACQALANVARDRYLVSPISLYFLVVAQSGERKALPITFFQSQHGLGRRTSEKCVNPMSKQP